MEDPNLDSFRAKETYDRGTSITKANEIVQAVAARKALHLNPAYFRTRRIVRDIVPKVAKYV